MSTDDGAPSLFLRASVGDPSGLLNRVEVAPCEHRTALVPVDRADFHLDWHRRTQPAVTQ